MKGLSAAESPLSKTPIARPARANHWRFMRPFLLFLSLALNVRADQPSETLPFFRPDGVFDSRGIDNINIFSGDTGVVIPLGPEYLLGPSTRWQLRAYNTAKFWHFSQTCQNDGNAKFAYVSGDPTLGVGWTLAPGYVDTTGGAVYWAPDGTPHSVGANGVAVDGSHLRLTLLSNPTSYTVEFPDGSIHKFAHAYTAPAGTTPSTFDFRNWWGDVGSVLAYGIIGG
jgi:hypothetical protein